MNRCIYYLFVFCIVCSCKTSQRTEIDYIRTIVKNEYLQSTVDTDDVALLMSRQQQDGSWMDIDYKNTSRAEWQNVKHVDRLLNMSLVYAQNISKKDEVLLKSIEKGLRYWFDNHFVCSNWWFNKIDIPRKMLAIAFILDGDVMEDIHKQLIKVIDTIDANDFPARPGGDRIQIVSNHAKAMLFKRDNKGIAKLFKMIEAEARFAPMEEIMYDAVGGIAVRNNYRPAGRGLQADLSFHHRGDRVNSTLTYGLELPEFYSYWADILKNTSFRLADNNTHLVIDYYLDGICKHLILGRQKEPSTVNREICRINEQEISSRLTHSLLNICDGYRESELITHIQMGENKELGTFSKFFWCSEYFAFQRPSYAVGVRMHSVRNMNMEYPHNGEGIRNHFRGDGACYLSVKGDEYTCTQPVYDFRRIPGTTTLLLNSFPDETQLQKEGKSKYVGAVTDGVYGAAAFDFMSPHYDLAAKKSWFFFDEGYVCLGNHITSSVPDTVVTTINQCKLKGNVYVKANGLLYKQPEGCGTLKDVGWVLHDSIGYLLLDHANILLSNKKEKGTWDNCVRNPMYPQDSVEMEIFSLSVNHGVIPKEEKYAYAIIPRTDEKQMNDYEKRSWFHILSNNEKVQAVEKENGSLVYIIFYEKGQISFDGGTRSIEVNQPCIVMIRGKRVYLSDPTRQLHAIKVRYNSIWKEIPLPTWQNAGSTIEIFFD